MTSASNVSPAYVFHGNIFPCHKLYTFHAWGYPVYVLDPKISNGQNLPRWQPDSSRGVFLGYSPTHSSDVPFVLNLATGHTSPHFYVLFDEAFKNVHSISDY